MVEELLEELEFEMEARLEVFKNGLTTIRTGGASPALVSGVTVDYYGMETPINQVASIQVVEGKQLLIKPYESRLVKDIEKAIHAANIGLNPQNEGNAIRIIVPSLTEERRREYAKKCKTMADEAKVAARNIRRDFNDKVKKDKTIPEDTSKELIEEIQKTLDGTIAKIDAMAAAKEKDIMTL